MRALDLFAGMGGASLGLERAGFDVTAVEFDETAARIHRHVCEGQTIRQDVSKMSPGHPSFNFDLLWASPPCQPFSSAGLQRGMDDPRAHLIFQVPRWVERTRPRFVICEQVQQALKWWEVFALGFEELGYHTWTGTLSAEMYGVPQTRKRAFLLASLDGPVSPPEPTHERYWNRAPHMRPTGLAPYVTMADVINMTSTDGVGFPRRDDQGGDGYRERDLRPVTEPAFTMTSKGRSWKIVGERCRTVTVEDGLILQTFPPDCLDGLEVTKTAAFKAIGNAVPPMWAETIARHLTGGNTHDDIG